MCSDGAETIHGHGQPLTNNRAKVNLKQEAQSKWGLSIRWEPVHKGCHLRPLTGTRWMPCSSASFWMNGVMFM